MPYKDPEKQKEYDRKHREYSWARKTRYGHKRNGFIINISINELVKMAKNTIYCPICGVKLCWNNSKIKSNSPSLDRINNGSIIAKELVMIICDQCNRTKGNRTLDEFIEYCKHVAEMAEEA